LISENDTKTLRDVNLKKYLIASSIFSKLHFQKLFSRFSQQSRNEICCTIHELAKEVCSQSVNMSAKILISEF